MNPSVITIKQISSLSGYSISTVSKALNNKLEISKATRETIKTIAKRHNYIPNNYAVSLRMQKTGSIAVILPDLNQFHFSHSLSHLQISAESFGYRILFYQSFNSYEKELKYINNLCDGSIDAIIVISSKIMEKTPYIGYSFPVELLHIDIKQSIQEIEQLSYNSLISVMKD